MITISAPLHRRLGAPGAERLDCEPLAHLRHEGLLALGDDIVGLAAILSRPGSTALSASTFLRPWSPQPKMADVLLSLRARCFAATAVAAAVRFAVIQRKSMIAIGRPVASSLRM